MLVGAGRAQAFYLCAYDAVARTSCCCPKADEPDVDTEARIEAACCCSIEERGAAAPAARSAERDTTSVADVPQVAVVPIAVPPARSLRSVVDIDRRSHAPPRPAARSTQHVALLL
jgi:hypothetical protein